MTLAIEGELGLGEAEQEGVHRTWDTIDEVEFELTMMGFPLMDKPEFIRPQINQALYTALSSGDGKTLTFEHTRFSAWYGYAISKISQFKGRLTQTKNELKDITTRTRRMLITSATTAAGKKPTEDMIDQEARLDPRYLELMLQQQRLEQAIEQLEGHAKELSSGKSLTSRTVEVRRQDMEGLDGGRAYGRHVPGSM